MTLREKVTRMRETLEADTEALDFSRAVRATARSLRELESELVELGELVAERDLERLEEWLRERELLPWPDLAELLELVALKARERLEAEDREAREILPGVTKDDWVRVTQALAARLHGGVVEHDQEHASLTTRLRRLEERVQVVETMAHPPVPVASPEDVERLAGEVEQLRERVDKLWRALAVTPPRLDVRAHGDPGTKLVGYLSVHVMYGERPRRLGHAGNGLFLQVGDASGEGEPPAVLFRLGNQVWEATTGVPWAAPWEEAREMEVVPLYFPDPEPSGG